MALAELGVEYEPVEVNLFERKHREPWFEDLNPPAKLPVLDDGTTMLFLTFL